MTSLTEPVVQDSELSDLIHVVFSNPKGRLLIEYFKQELMSQPYTNTEGYDASQSIIYCEGGKQKLRWLIAEFEDYEYGRHLTNQDENEE